MLHVRCAIHTTHTHTHTHTHTSPPHTPPPNTTHMNTHREGHESASSNPKIGMWMLAGLTYYCVSGGPMGSEVAVKAGGAAGALAGFIIMPLVWSLPEALMTAGMLPPPPQATQLRSLATRAAVAASPRADTYAPLIEHTRAHTHAHTHSHFTTYHHRSFTTELSVALPEAAGFSAWTNAAFGPFFGFLTSYFKWVSGITDNAIYPLMALQVDHPNSPPHRLTTPPPTLPLYRLTASPPHRLTASPLHHLSSPPTHHASVLERDQLGDRHREYARAVALHSLLHGGTHRCGLARARGDRGGDRRDGRRRAAAVLRFHLFGRRQGAAGQLARWAPEPPNGFEGHQMDLAA